MLWTAITDVLMEIICVYQSFLPTFIFQIDYTHHEVIFYQGYFNTACCSAGSCYEQSCPHFCLCCESCLCNSMAISATRSMVMDQYELRMVSQQRKWKTKLLVTILFHYQFIIWKFMYASVILSQLISQNDDLFLFLFLCRILVIIG